MMRTQPSRLLLGSRVRPIVAALACALGVLCAGQARAQDLNATIGKLTDIEASAQQLQKQPLQHSQLRSPTHVEERLTDGELFFRLQDYVRASVIFTDIVDNYPQHRAYPDALFLLGESLFKANDYLGARARYRMIIEHADQPAYAPYVQRALGRLIEIAIHTRDFEGVDDYFTRLSKLPPSEVEAATNYFRAKYLYSVAIRDAEGATGDVNAQKVDVAKLDQARLSFEAVGERSPYFAQARYFIGVIYLLRGQYGAAIDAFHRVCKLKVTSEEQRRITELARIAIGRLRYEQDQLDAAIEAYQAVPRTSQLFDTALYEIAWVYIRMGDSTRAERALEVLSVAVPDSKHIPDGKLLRGNLLLRDGRFDDASRVFTDVSAQFGPVREELDRVLAQHEDAVAYFRQLVRDNLESFDVSAFLPPSALHWANTEGEMQRAMDALSDLSQARQLVGETEDIIARLNAALAAPNPIAVFRDLRSERERTVALRNRVLRVRQALSAIDARQGKQFTSPELDQLRARRREIEQSLSEAPTKQEDIEKRALSIVRQYDALQKELSRLEVELLGMEARITATDHFISRPGTAQAPEAQAAVRSELTTQKGAIGEYRTRMKELALLIESGRLQVGVGDQNYAREDALRKEYAQIVGREHEVLRSLGAKLDANVDVALQRVARVEAVLDLHDREIDLIVAERAQEMRQVLDEEGAKLTGYRAQLASLEGESEEVVGGIALDNHRKVRQRFYDLVLRADVGVVDVSWAVREEHRIRAEALSRERARALKSLEDEYRDIMDQQREAEQ
jgi:TolA-binding protein